MFFSKVGRSPPITGDDALGRTSRKLLPKKEPPPRDLCADKDWLYSREPAEKVPHLLLTLWVRPLCGTRFTIIICTALQPGIEKTAHHKSQTPLMRPYALFGCPEHHSGHMHQDAKNQVFLVPESVAQEEKGLEKNFIIV